jgi:hypothetical protein
VSELLSSIVKVSHGDLGAHRDRVCFERLIALLSHDLAPKGFYSRRDKSDLEGVTQTLTMIGVSEGTLPGVVGRIK